MNDDPDLQAIILVVIAIGLIAVGIAIGSIIIGSAA